MRMSDPEKLQPSPILVQYLAALCALNWGALAVNVDVTSGNTPEDTLAEQPHDVDVTITVDTPDGIHAFKGFEVRHWSNPLDAADIDVLVAKFNDIPEITHRAIVSSSGFTETAIGNATHHNVELFTFAPWDRPISEHFYFLASMKTADQNLINDNFIYLQWNNAEAWVGTNSPPMNFQPDEPLYDANGNSHPEYSTYSAYSEALLLRSSNALASVKPIRDMALPLIEALSDRRPDPLEPQWHWGYTADCSGDAVYFTAPDGELYQIETLTIYGMLQWKRTPVIYSALEGVPNGELFSGAIIAPSSTEGRMSVIAFPASNRELSFGQIQLQPKHLDSIRELNIAISQE